MNNPTDKPFSEEWQALRTFLMTMIAFFVFLGAVAAALKLETLHPTALPVAQTTVPTLVPTAVPLASPTFAQPTAPVETIVVPTVTVAAAATTHLVQSGETLTLIAGQYNLTLAALLAANPLSDPDVVWAGQELLIPGVIQKEDPTTPLTVTLPLTATTINDIPFDQIIVMSPAVIANMRATYARGQTLGRNPQAFAKIGDSTIDVEYFLSPFARVPYELGSYAFLQPTINFFAGSFNRQGMAVRMGLHSWTALDPLWADKTVCAPAETVIACEFRLHNPSIVLIRLGANDAGVPENFARNMGEIVAYALEQGVIPVLGTKADRAEGSDENNAIIRQVAADYEIPLWDFDRVAATLPGRGLDEDGVHLNTPLAYDYRQTETLARGHAVHNLTALLVLDTIRKEIMKGEG